MIHKKQTICLHISCESRTFRSYCPQVVFSCFLQQTIIIFENYFIHIYFYKYAKLGKKLKKILNRNNSSRL